MNFYDIDPIGDQKEVNGSQIKISSKIGHYANTANKVLKNHMWTRTDQLVARCAQEILENAAELSQKQPEIKTSKLGNQLQKRAWISFLAHRGEKVKNQSNDFKMTWNLVEELKTSRRRSPQKNQLN